ncbi:5683_t:CDS:1 [Ambispora leptoticha]|uniref:5683_t:CDS:1 n=1 Tax=Ambispora leptoticha TaxID=144679 RepID=A0A9N8VR87_9GLOM|nr:5683_t:CDS:1 [Ambispora leptoticha]
MGKSNVNKNTAVSAKEKLHRVQEKSIKKTISKSENKRNKIILPNDFKPDVVYQPRFSLEELICGSDKVRSSSKPPRPLNSYFLLKKCLLLELWARNLKPTMPAACVLAKKLWDNAPEEAKNIYEDLARQAEEWHQKTFPNYVFEPKKRPQCKNKPFPEKNSSGMLLTFTLESPSPQQPLQILEPPRPISDVETTNRNIEVSDEGILIEQLKNIQLDNLNNVYLVSPTPMNNSFQHQNDVDYMYQHQDEISQFNYPGIESIFSDVDGVMYIQYK